MPRSLLRALALAISLPGCSELEVLTPPNEPSRVTIPLHPQCGHEKANIPDPAPPGWYRGNTHAHTSANSFDAYTSPVEVARWYSEHNYNFLFITDHQYPTDVTPLNNQLAVAGKFLVLPGMEVTQTVIRNGESIYTHVSSLGATAFVRGPGSYVLNERGGWDGTWYWTTSDGSAAYAYTTIISSVRSAGGLTQINHPNLKGPVQLHDLEQLSTDTMLYELWNVMDSSHNDGEAGAPSTEELWDSLLTRGKSLFAVAADDSHQLGAQSAEGSGGAWIMVRSNTLTQAAILAALKRGDFYASTGVALREVGFDGRTLAISVQPANQEEIANQNRWPRILFVGAGGKVLYETRGHEASYMLKAGDGYVRARVTDERAFCAWTQPNWPRSGP
jgi:hypothetical protein